MSTILDVLRKAQEDARGRTGRQRIDPGDLPGIVLDRDRPRRRLRAWMLVPVALVLLAGLAGGLFLTEGARAPRSRRADTEGGMAPPERPATARPAAAPGRTEAAVPPGGSGTLAQARAAAENAAALAAVPAPVAASVAAPIASPAVVARAAAQPAAPAPAPKVAATRAPIGRAPETRTPPLGEAPIGVPRAPDYLERVVGPDGKTETRLRSVDPSTLRRGGTPRAQAPVAEEPRRPLVRHAEDLPPPGLDGAGARVAAEGESPAAASPPGGSAAVDEAGQEGTGENAPAGGRAGRPSAPAPEVRRLPSGLPEVEVNIVQWSPSADRRFAFVRVDGSAMVKVREGDEVGGLLVVRIHPQGIELSQDDGRWLLRTD